MKQCNICSETKPYTEYYKNSYLKSGYANRCKPCQKKYTDKYRKSKKGKKQSKERQQRHQRFINRVKLWKGCSHCGYKTHAVAIDFDHVDPSIKRGDGYSAVNSSWSMKRIKDEIRKCRILCSNCHRASTHGLL